MKPKNIKIVTVFLLTTVLLFSFTSFALAATSVNPTPNPSLIKDTATGIATKLVNVAQGVFGVAAVCFIIFAGIMFWGAGGDPNKIVGAKKALAGFIIAMICVFFADKIVGGLMGIFGL